MVKPALFEERSYMFKELLSLIDEIKIFPDFKIKVLAIENYNIIPEETLILKDSHNTFYTSLDQVYINGIKENLIMLGVVLYWNLSGELHRPYNHPAVIIYEDERIISEIYFVEGKL